MAKNQKQKHHSPSPTRQNQVKVNKNPNYATNLSQQEDSATTNDSSKSPFTSEKPTIPMTNNQDFITQSLIKHLQQKCTEMAALADSEVEQKKEAVVLKQKSEQYRKEI